MEKKKSIVFKKIIVSILSILFVVYAYCPRILQVKADTSNVITYNSYGSTTRGTRGFEAFGSTYALIAFIDFNFNGQYNGIINIYLTGATPMSNFSVICENCHILSQSTNYLQIEFYGQNNVSVNFVMKNATAGSFDIQSVTYQSMSKVGDSNTAELVNIKNRLSDIKTYTDGIEGLLATNNSLLQDIKNNTSNSSGGSNSTVNNIDVNVDLIADDLNLLKTTSDGILSALVDFLTDGVGGLLTIENVIDAIESTTTALLGVQTQLTTINGQLTSITNLLSSIDTNLQNIDNTIDTISWINDTVDIQISGDGTTWKNSGYVTAYRADGDYAYIRVNTWLNGTENLYKFTLNFGAINIGSTGNYKVEIGYLNSNNEIVMLTENNDNSIYYSGSVYRWGIMQNIYLTNFYTYDTNYPLIIKIQWLNNSSGNKRLYMPTSVSHISQNDIEYWQLIEYFNQYNSYEKLLDRISSISVNISQSDINEMNNNINEYNSVMTDINQIENNYINNFNTVDNNIDLTNNSSPSVNLVDARLQFNSVFNDITADLRIRGLLIFVLICGVVLILLGA